MCIEKSQNKAAEKIEIVRCKVMKIHQSFYFQLRNSRSTSVTMEAQMR